MAIESGCKLFARCSLTILLYFFLLSFRFNSFSYGVICSFLVAFFYAYKSRRLLFKSAFCLGDIAALRALSSSRLRSFGHVTILSMELDVFTAPIYNKKSTISNKIQKDTYCKNINLLLHCHEPQLGCPLHFFFSNR